MVEVKQSEERLDAKLDAALDRVMVEVKQSEERLDAKLKALAEVLKPGT